ncbi:TlpA family protein disulfide reductase [Spirosoma linguale]|uniref:Redoxin domain protein n=1 Tax=Spirosoma linguale (strain ATCC 33905 / DSM 74 / LMG 10896 / Claus 1) TaxID=504472 RepID=D2QH77_SPILD|nr:Redoxin domain protein [Spirosoma linguale DSM 74]
MKIDISNPYPLILAYLLYIGHQNLSAKNIIPHPEEPNCYLDSIKIIVNKKKQKSQLEFEDYFGNKLTLQKGENVLFAPLIIKDVDWRHQTKFIFDKPIALMQFIQNDQGYWCIKAGNDNLDKEFNFDVHYRQEISPILTSGWARLKFVNANYMQDVQKRKNDIDKYFSVKGDYLNSYASKYGLSRSFITKWQTIIKYEKLSSMLFVGSNYQKWPKLYLTELNKIIYEFNDDYLYLSDYREGCIQLLHLKAFLMLGKDVTLSQYYELAERSYTGKTKEYILLTLLLQSQDKYSDIKTTNFEYGKLVKKYLGSCQVKEFCEYLSKSKLPNKINTYNYQLLNIDRKQVDFSEITKQATINYIDFWASWCVPCRAEMPDSKKLSEEYTAKGINFIYISIDENSAAWERAMNQIGLPKKNSFLLPYFKKSQLYKKYNISTIPRYLLIDKQGNLISDDAPRPSDPKIREKLNNLLKK